jgi:hypothetical protein
MRLPDVERAVAMGNDSIDACAKEAIGSHPALEAGWLTDVGKTVQRARWAVRILAYTLSCFPREERQTKLHGPRRRFGARVSWHSWAWEGKRGWHCTACWIDAGPRAKVGELPMTGCRGLPKRWEAVSDRVLKHSFVTATVAMQDEAFGRRPIVLCMKCGRWAQHRLVGLAEPCRQVADRYGAEGLRCIDKGKHPDTHQTAVRVEV